MPLDHHTSAVDLTDLLLDEGDVALYNRDRIVCLRCYVLCPVPDDNSEPLLVQIS